MTMKIFYACLMVLFFTAMPVFAQDQSPSDAHQPPSTEEIVSKMQSRLNLTQDQVTAITPIIEKYSSQRDELRQSMEDGTGDSDSIHKQMKQLLADEKQELSQVLSADQLSQWEKFISQERRKQNGEGGGKSWGGGNAGGDSGKASSSAGDNAPAGQ